MASRVPPAAPTRRQEYAAATRQAIVDAARAGFAANGFFATRIEDIALEARVSPATVYTAYGSKQGLLTSLVRSWTDSPRVQEGYQEIGALDSGRSVLETTARITVDKRLAWGDVVDVLLATAPHDKAVAAELLRATGLYRGSFEVVARRLQELDALQQGATRAHAVGVLWFYFGFGGARAALIDNQWSPKKAITWLTEAAASQLLR